MLPGIELQESSLCTVAATSWLASEWPTGPLLINHTMYVHVLYMYYSCILTPHQLQPHAQSLTFFCQANVTIIGYLSGPHTSRFSEFPLTTHSVPLG